MLKHFDRMTVAVTDLAAARRFFALLGFEEDKAVVISGPVMDRYMGVPGIEADHVTLALKGASPRCEIQLLHYRKPAAAADPTVARLDKIGFNHILLRRLRHRRADRQGDGSRRGVAQPADGLPRPQAGIPRGTRRYRRGAGRMDLRGPA